MIVQIHAFVLGYKGTKESNKEAGLVLLNYRLILVSAQYVSILQQYFKAKLNNHYNLRLHFIKLDLPKLINQYQDLLLEAGCDEAGRGCYAGPVFAAAVILPKDFYHPMLNDSKQLTEKQREELVPIIKEAAISWAVAHQSSKEIDNSNILKAAIKCMHLSLDELKPKAKFIAVDGNRFYAYKKIPHQTIIKGDGLYANIAAASILAKTARDSWMQKLHKKYPQYGWDKNKGYGTAAHRAAIAQYGLCYEHRKSFKILPPQLSLL